MYSIDIIIVTFNSEKWILDCLRSIEHQHYPLEKINLVVVDNNSSDKTLLLLEQYKNKCTLNNFTIKKLEENLGFGKANNLGVDLSQSPYLFFLNIDTELQMDALTNLMYQVEKSDEQVAAWEVRQTPYEHPKHYNPVTLEVSWASAAALLVTRKGFMDIQGFDSSIFMYGEDVDLSWRLREKGYKIIYVTNSVVRHYTYEKEAEARTREVCHIIFNDIFLRWRYGTGKQIILGYFNLYLLLKQKAIVKQMSKGDFWGRLLKLHKTKGHLEQGVSHFSGLNYEIHRAGAKHSYPITKQQPLVSIIVRTHQRPAVLYEAIQSIANQTYRNIEIIIIEDGQPSAKEMLEQNFSHLNIVYYATEKSVGRTRAANKGLELARGKYLNFLDDDDLFYADHIEVLCATLENNSDYKVAYSLAFETPINVRSNVPYQYEEIYYNIEFKHEYSHEELLSRNYLPIQTVMFKREVYEQLGGLDEGLEVLEDWDFWLKISSHYSFYYVEKTTSIYRVPANVQNMHKRKEQFLASSEKIFLKYGHPPKPARSTTLKNKLQNFKFNFKLNKHETLKMLRYKIKQKILVTLKK